MAHIESDLMLIALLTKGLEIIDNDSGIEHENLRKTLEAEIRTIKTRLGNVLKPVHSPTKNKSKLSDDDKQFIMDEMMSILGGKLGSKSSNTQTWESKSSPSQFSSKVLGDFLSSVMRYDWDTFDENEEKKEKEEQINNMIKRKKNNNNIIKNNDFYKPINWDDDIND